MKHRIVLSVLICLLGAAPLAFAEKIYKWVDSEGNTHYGSQPGGNQSEELKIHNLPAKSTATPTTQPAGQPQPSFMESFEKEQQEKAEAAAKAAEEKELRDKNCVLARKRMASLEMGGRIYEVDEKGERNYLSDADRQSRLQQAKEDVAKWCE